MVFTKLQGLLIQPDHFTSENEQLRCSLYIEFANTNSLQQLYSNIITAFKTHLDENLLPQIYDQDILHMLFKENKYKSTIGEIDVMGVKVHVRSQPLFSAINVAPSLRRSHQVVAKLDNIGYQHLYMLPKDSSESSNSNTSDSDSGTWDFAPLRKKLKTCRKAIEVDSASMLKYHRKNLTLISEITVHVDILIFVDRSFCKQLSKYLGLIYLEDLLTEVEENNMDSVLLRLNNKNAKLCGLIQTYINKKLIQGCNNICLVHTLELWENISANVRAVISNKDDQLLYLEPVATTNVHVELGKNPSGLRYIEAISSIINNALSFESHVIARYEADKDSCYSIKLPIISVVPLYVLKYFAQCEIRKQMHKSNCKCIM